MSETLTPLSLNEICFYFTRAAVGAGAPFGIGEDFAEASKSLAYLGFDPAQAAVPALRGLRHWPKQHVALAALRGEMPFVSGVSDAPILSALYAGPVVADRLSIEAGCGRERHLRLDDTDQPLLIVGAVAAADIDAARIALSWPLRNGRRAVVELNGGIATVAGLYSRSVASLQPAPVDILLNGTPPRRWSPRARQRVEVSQRAGPSQSATVSTWTRQRGRRCWRSSTSASCLPPIGPAMPGPGPVSPTTTEAPSPDPVWGQSVRRHAGPLRQCASPPE